MTGWASLAPLLDDLTDGLREDNDRAEQAGCAGCAALESEVVRLRDRVRRLIGVGDALAARERGE